MCKILPKYLLFLLLFSVHGVTACTESSKHEQPYIFKSQSFGIRFEYPHDWQYQFKNQMAVFSPKFSSLLSDSSFALEILTKLNHDGKPRTHTQVQQAIIKELQTQTDYTLELEEQTNLSGVPVIHLITGFSRNTRHWKQEIVIFKQPEHFYIFYLKSSPEQFENARYIFQNMLLSLSFSKA